MQIVIIESTASRFRWELDTQGKRVSLFGCDDGFPSFEDCLCDVRSNVENWAGLLAPPARSPLAHIQLMFESPGDAIRLSCGTTEETWPELFWSIAPSVTQD